MENQFNREEDFLKKLWDEQISEKPSADLKNKIMSRIESNKVLVKEYKPLIPETVWWLLIIFIATATGGLYFQSPEIHTNFSRFGIPQIKFTGIEFSKTMQYAVAFLALFFLHIPFLKRYMDQQYEV